MGRACSTNVEEEHIKPEGKRLPRDSWVDNIRMDHGEVG
jgi:hypothetical protein